MLDAMRRGAQTRVAKLLFGILCVSFGIWGVADVFQGWGRGSIAEVGDTSISAEDFRRAYQNELNRISEQAKRHITAEQGHAMGFDRRVLAQLIDGAALEAHARDIGLAISDKTLIKGIENDPNFQGPDGKFSRQGFEQLLNQIGLSERGFLKLRRQDELRAALVKAFIAGQTIPKPLFNIVHAYNDEKRVLEWIKIDPNAVTVAEPTEAKLKEAYDQDKAKYMTPEYRKVGVLMLTVDDLKKGITVTDDEIAKEYETAKASYNTPEKRRIQQIAFKDKASAEAALKALRDGTKTFGDVVKEAGAKASDVDLGLLSKKQLIDPKVAEAAFSLEKDKYSDVVEGRFATVILRVTQIVPGITRTLADVKDEVKDKLASDKARADLQNKRDEVDDKRLAGNTLKEISDALKLPFKAIPAIDSKGTGPDGKPVMETPYLGKITQHIFSPDGSTDDMSFDLSNDAFAWTNVISTEAPKQKTFDQVKDEVKSDYLNSERHRLIDELAKKLADRVNSGEAVSALETAAKNKAEKTDPITRKTVLQSVSDSVIQQAFALPKGKAGFGPSPDGTTDLVYRVADIIPAPKASLTETVDLDRDLQADLANQTLNEYTDALRKRYGATINQAELDAAVGVSEQ